MIPYHGGRFSSELIAAKTWRGRHAFISHADPDQVGCAAAFAQSFALDNGAFSFWLKRQPVTWIRYYDWCEAWLFHPACDWAVIPDVIDGDEAANDALLEQWPFRDRGVPVWHLHESLDRLQRLCDRYCRVALGSSGAFSEVGTMRWWVRMAEAMEAVCDPFGRPRAKLHGLRMLDPEVFTRLPFSSADSTNVSRNIGMDSAWRGTYTPASKATRALVLAERIEAEQAAPRWISQPVQRGLV